MSSLIAGYNYDIFISYRQKDNKYDGWVTEFVDNLKKELEATFKEEISVYFDINPHDGLLETHNVDASLKEKLKCLVFIPIISRTYCDPESFAWLYEFCAFNKLTKEDKFGKEIKLSSGNVGSRILPVQIHDLDADDKKLIENELGGFIRGIEFIYKEPGVNRPLRSNEDNPDNNLNKTYYRNQINKVANAVKELISALKKQDQFPEEVVKKDLKVKSGSRKDLRTKVVVRSVIALLLIVFGILLIPKQFKPTGKIEKSIAVLPFINDSPDQENAYFINGIMNEILNNLMKISDFRVLPRTSTEQFKGTNRSAIPEIARKLGVNYIIEGSGQKYANKFRLRIQLIKAKGKEAYLWANSYEEELEGTDDLFQIQSEIAKAIAKELKVKITPEEKQLIEKTQTNNLEAYDLYLQGRFYLNIVRSFKESIAFFEMAIAKDPEFALAYAGLANAYFVLTWNGGCPKMDGYARAKKTATKALEIDRNLAEAHMVIGSILAWYEWNWKEAQKEYTLAIELNPNSSDAHQFYSNLLDILRKDDDARLQINRAMELDPFSHLSHWFSSLYYYNQGRFTESLDEYLKAEELSPQTYTSVDWGCFPIYWRMGENLRAMEEIKKILQMDTLNAKYADNVKEIYSKSGIEGLLIWWIDLQLKSSSPSPLSLARWYAMLDKKPEALNWLEKALEERSSNIPRINNNPDFDNLRLEPRFQEIIKEVRLTEYTMKNNTRQNMKE